MHQSCIAHPFWWAGCIIVATQSWSWNNAWHSCQHHNSERPVV